MNHSTRTVFAGWLSRRWRALLVHSIAVTAFLSFCAFLSEPIFDRFTTIAGEASQQSIHLPAETGDIRFGLDRLDVGVHITELRGWAFIDGHSPDDGQTYVVLKSGGARCVFDTQVELRPDVTSACGDSNLDLDRSGFICNIPSRKIGNGPYVIGIYISNAGTDALTYTDFILTKR